MIGTRAFSMTCCHTLAGPWWLYAEETDRWNRHPGHRCHLGGTLLLCPAECACATNNAVTGTWKRTNHAACFCSPDSRRAGRPNGGLLLIWLGYPSLFEHHPIDDFVWPLDSLSQCDKKTSTGKPSYCILLSFSWRCSAAMLRFVMLICVCGLEAKLPNSSQLRFCTASRCAFIQLNYER